MDLHPEARVALLYGIYTLSAIYDPLKQPLLYTEIMV